MKIRLFNSPFEIKDSLKIKFISFIIFLLGFNSTYAQFYSGIFVKVNPPFFLSSDENSDKQGFIKIDNFSYELFRNDALSTPEKNSISQPLHGSLHIYMRFGNSTLFLFEEMYKQSIGRNLEIVFSSTKADNFQILTFDNFVIVAVEPEGAAMVSITIDFTKFKIENYDLNADGTKKSSTVYGWDYVTNKSW